MYCRMCISKRTISAHQTHPGVCIQSLQLAVRLSHACAITGVFSDGGEGRGSGRPFGRSPLGRGYLMELRLGDRVAARSMNTNYVKVLRL